MTETSYLACAGLAAILVAAFRMLWGKSKSEKPNELPPKNDVAQVAIDNVQEGLKEEIDRIESATTGDSPADDLADLGNARKRR